MAIEFLSEKAFESLPENKPAPMVDTFWDPIIEAFGDRKVVKIPFAHEKEKRGQRLSIGRRVKKAGFSVELRYSNDFIAVRRANDSRSELTQEELPVVGDQPAQPQPRRRKTATNA